MNASQRDALGAVRAYHDAEQLVHNRLDHAIASAMRQGVSSRTIARTLGVSHTTVCRRAQRGDYHHQERTAA